MADVFLTEDYEDCADDNNEIDSLTSSAEIKVEIEDLDEPQKLLNDDIEDLNESSTKDSSDMTLKEDTSDPELFAADDLLVNPDDLLPPVVKLEKYANSEIVFNRQVVVRNLLETLRLVHGNKDDVARVISVLCSISEDFDPSVRTELMVQLPHIAAFSKEITLSNTIVQCIVPMIITYLGDENIQVRKSCHSTLLSLIEQELFNYDTIREKMSPLILHLTDIIHPEDLRTEAIVLMSKVIVVMGKKAAEEFFFERLFALCADKTNNIRKACASTFGDICTTVGREATEEVLLPKFFSLCEDTAWCVRKACAENFMPVSCVVSRETRRKELSSLYMILLTDQSRWVRMTAFQALGPFISTFAEPDRTGLYYSKEGVLTILDTPCPEGEQSTDNSICNGEVDGPDDNASSSDGTSSSIPCDSVVPLCSTDESLSASEVPGISCHVSNYCTVIEVSSSTMTSATISKETADDADSSEDGFHCDSNHMSEILSSGDNWTVFDASKTIKNKNNCNKVDDSTNLGDTEDTFNDSLTKEEKEFNKLWYEALYGCDETVVNGAVNSCIINGEDIVENHVDSDVVHIKSEEKSTILSAITVNGINLSSSIALSGPMNCESIPLISCSNSLKESAKSSKDTDDLSSKSESEIQHSTCKDCESSDINPSLTFSSQELNNTFTDILKTDSVESVQLKVSTEPPDDESAFNYFQYWRDPLPDIDIDIERVSLTHSYSSNRFTKRFCMKTGARRQVSRQYYFPNPRELRIGEVITMADDETSENKGEPPPPPGSKLSPLDQDIVPPELLSQYLSMINAAWAHTVDAEIARHCAYSLPAVALTLGRQFWPCLKETFDALSSDLQGFIMMWKVRRTVASAMHQLAVILGPDITSQDLLPVFFRFINDLDEVRVGILQHLCEFLKVLRQEDRNQFLPSLPEFLVSNSDSDSNEKNWRFRLILAEQLVSIADLYKPWHVRNHLVPLSLTLIKDKVCEVRLAAVRIMAAVMKRLSQSPVHSKAVISELTENFVHSPKWLYRQLYVYICQQIILEKSLSPDQFAEDALPQLLYLCWDRVPNVRIAIARCLVIVIWPIEVFSNPESPHRELLLQTIHTLQSDMDADVRFYANMVSTHECSCLQNGGFTNVAEPFV